MRRIDIRWVLPDPTGGFSGPSATLRPSGREVKRDLCRLGEQSLSQRSELMQAAVDGCGEQQACRSDEQSGDGIKRRQSFEGDARAALERDEYRRGDQRAPGKNDRERRQRDRERAAGDELVDSRLGDGERADRHEEAEGYVVSVR